MADLRARLISALGLAALAVLPIWIGGWAAAAFIALAAGVMGWEFRRITGGVDGGADPLVYGAGLAAAAALAGTGEAAGAGVALAATAFGFAALDWRAGRPAGWAVVGALTAGLAAACFGALRADPEHGLALALWIAAIVVATDTGAFFAGRLIGGPKLWPAVSPRKTWSGLIGGAGLATLAGLAFSALTPDTAAAHVAAVSALAAIVAQGGDLAESALKRRFGVKDSGRLMPGHGGALDRLDGFCAVALVAAAVTFARGTPVFRW